VDLAPLHSTTRATQAQAGCSQVAGAPPPRLIVQLNPAAVSAASAAAGDITSAAPGLSNVQLLSSSLNLVTINVAGGSLAQAVASLNARRGRSWGQRAVLVHEAQSQAAWDPAACVGCPGLA
jgi:hypothetical protein